MPDLQHSLRDHDLGHLLIIAEGWGVPLAAPDARQALPELAEALLDAELAAEVIAALPETARAALDDLQRHNGRQPWALFTRRYGHVREMGPGRRDRERPDRTPASPAEFLWYRALIARAFFDTPGGPQEFAYIPSDLLARLPQERRLGAQALGRRAAAQERAQPMPATDRVLDDACSLLAALRMGFDLRVLGEIAASWSLPPEPLGALLLSAGMIAADGQPEPDLSRAFLEAARGQALSTLVSAWRSSPDFDELRLVPHLQAEGEWENDPLRARAAILGFLAQVPGDTWWSLPALVDAVRTEHPDFQRPAGDYDSWFIRDRRTGAFLRGFENWDAVDGELIRYLITGPLHWLGVLDLAAPQPGLPPTAFRHTAWGPELLAGRAPGGLADESEPVHIRSDGRLRVPRLAGRALRYQLARFGEWQGEDEKAYAYLVTPASLARARAQGLRVGHLLALLRKAAETVPPNLVRALDRWETHGVEARLEQVQVLRLADPETLRELRRSRAARFLGDPLGPTAVIVKAGAWEKVQAVLTEMGILAAHSE